MRQNVVAVVEDDPGMLKSIDRLLTTCKFQTAMYTSAESFIDGLAAGEPACLVIDIHLGGMSGIELRRKADGVRPDFPVIHISRRSETVRQEASCSRLRRLSPQAVPGASSDRGDRQGGCDRAAERPVSAPD